MRKMAQALALALAAGALALGPAAARAEVSGFSAGDGSIAEAQGPIEAGNTYSGQFDAAPGQQDLDYLWFEVKQPGVVTFLVENTLSSCPLYREEGGTGYYEPEHFCPLWATLLDGNGNQLGGEGSAAGTGPVEYHSYEELRWPITTPGRYYLVLESDFNGCLPTFRIGFDVPFSGQVANSERVCENPAGGGSGGSSGSSGGGGSTSKTGSGSGGSNGSGTSKGGSGSNGSGTLLGPLMSGEVGLVTGHTSPSFSVSGSRALIRSLKLSGRQHGTHVIATVVLAKRLLSLELQLLARVGPRHRLQVVGRRLLRHPIAGGERIMVPVKAGRWLTARHYTSLLLRVRAQAAGGAHELVRGRLLLRR